MKLIISEQEKKRIKFLYGIVEQTPANVETPEEKAAREAKEYPNYCGYPKYAKIPGKSFGEGGAGGSDLFIDGHCLYECPVEGTLNYRSTGIWLPWTGSTKDNSETRIKFVDDEVRTKLFKRYKSYLNTVANSPLDDLELAEQIYSLYKDGMVYSFSISGIVYNTAITYAPDMFRISFAGYYVVGAPLTDEYKYKSPKWVDKRNSIESFIDEYGMAVQLSVAALTIILAPITAGSSLALWIEIGVELGLGIPVAIREWQRGDRIDGAFSFVCSFLPMLKLRKSYLGYSDETWESLARYLRTAPPPGTSDAKFAEWLSKMDIDDRKLFNQLVEDDLYHYEKIIEEVKNGMSGYLSVGLLDDVKRALKDNPTLADQLKYWDTVGGRDLKLTLLSFGVSTVLDLLWGDILNADDKGRLDKLWMEIPDNVKPEFYTNVMNNPEKIPEIINKTIETMEDVEQELGDEVEDFSDAMGEVILGKLKDTLDTNYIDSNPITKEVVPETLSEPELQAASEDGWMLFTTWIEKYPGQEIKGKRYINNDLYVKGP